MISWCTRSTRHEARVPFADDGMYDGALEGAERDVARATAALAAAEAGERGPLQSGGGSRPEAEFEAEGLDDDSIPEAMDEERMIEAGRWHAGYAGYH